MSLSFSLGFTTCPFTFASYFAFFHFARPAIYSSVSLRSAYYGSISLAFSRSGSIYSCFSGSASSSCFSTLTRSYSTFYLS